MRGPPCRTSFPVSDAVITHHIEAVAKACAPKEAGTSFEENRRKLNEFMRALDDGDEAKAVALMDEYFQEDYVLHTGGSTLRNPIDVVGREGLREHTRVAFS